MRIKRRFTFSEREKNIIKFLEKQKVEYIIAHNIGVLEIFEDDDKYVEISQYLAKNNIKPNPATSQCIYTKQELDDAKWLILGSTWHNGYPQPQGYLSYVEKTYDVSGCCKECYAGKVQNDSFVLKKPPKWGRRNFFALTVVYDEFFISDKARSVFIKNNVTGIEYKNVLHGLKKREVIEDTKQIFVKNRLRPGLAEGMIAQNFICPKCDSVNHLLNVGFFNYYKQAFEGVIVDVIKTSEYCGTEGMGSSLVFVTQRLRKIIIDNGLENGVYFIPVQMVCN